MYHPSGPDLYELLKKSFINFKLLVWKVRFIYQLALAHGPSGLGSVCLGRSDWHQDSISAAMCRRCQDKPQSGPLFCSDLGGVLSELQA